MAKAILTVTRMDIQEAPGSIQLCAGQISGIECMLSADSVCSFFQRDETEAILLVDASTAFNSALCNIRRLCPSRPTTATECQLNFLLMVRCCIPVNIQLKGTHCL